MNDAFLNYLGLTKAVCRRNFALQFRLTLLIKFKSSYIPSRNQISTAPPASHNASWSFVERDSILGNRLIQAAGPSPFLWIPYSGSKKCTLRALSCTAWWLMMMMMMLIYSRAKIIQSMFENSSVCEYPKSQPKIAQFVNIHNHNRKYLSLWISNVSCTQLKIFQFLNMGISDIELLPCNWKIFQFLKQ